MLTLHLEHQGKTAKVSLHALPPSRPKPNLTLKTTCGPITPVKIRNGLNLRVQPAFLTAADLIAGDPELDLTHAGQTIYSDDLTAAWFDPAADPPKPIGDFREIDIAYGPDGSEKERRPHLSRKRNLDELHPVKSGKRLPLIPTLTGFVFKSSLQIVHEDGVTRDFLFNIAKDLHTSQEMLVLGTGPKGNLPLVVRDDGTPYRGFLYGDISPDGQNYQLLLLLSDQELKLPALDDFTALMEKANVQRALFRAELYLPRTAGTPRSRSGDINRISHAANPADLALLKLAIFDIIMLDGRDLRAQQETFTQKGNPPPRFFRIPQLEAGGSAAQVGMMPFPSMLRFSATGAFASLLLACSAPARPSPVPVSGWTLSKTTSPWEVAGFEEDKDLSGIASLDNKTILLGSDELIAAQLGTLDKAAGLITAGSLVPLMQNPSGKKMEIDIEGVAADPAEHCYYVTGSHGVGKKKGEFEESRASVFKIPTDPATGAIKTDGIQRASLMPWLEQQDTFKDYTKKPLQLNGFNIEGLSFHDGKLYFGVRGPNVQGSTFIIETTPASLFGGSLPDCILHPLAIGETRGIRELAAVRDGFILITGNASAEATKKFPTSQTRIDDKVFDVFLWQPGRTPALSSIGVLPKPTGKAEAILVLEDAPTYVDILILFDGAPGGGPQAYRLTRP